MKRSRLFVLMLAIVIILSLMHFNFGLFTRFNFFTAYWDSWTGNERIIIYGEPDPTDSIKQAFAPKFGFAYERQAGCIVTTPFVNGVRSYNSIMANRISKRLGEDWNEVLTKEILKGGSSQL